MENKDVPERLDVDVRFLLANERTLLAWIRTSLAVEAGGLALASVHVHHRYIGVIILLLGGASALIGYRRYKTTDRSIRRNHLPPSGSGPRVEVAGIVLVAIVLAIAQLTVLR